MASHVNALSPMVTLMKNVLIALVIVIALAMVGSMLGGIASVTNENTNQPTVVTNEVEVGDQPVRVYMIQAVDTDNWYRRNAFNLVGWGAQDQGRVWTVKNRAESARDALFGSRETVVRAFVLLAVGDD